MTTTSVGMRCPECARQTTQVRTARNFRSEPTVTYALIAANVVIALGALLSGSGLLGSFGASPLVALGGLSGPAVAEGQWWRLVTAGFLHAGPLHLAFNMYTLYILGGMLEPAIGRLRFALVYVVSLLAGSFGAILLSPNALTVGASGAIFGVAGATIVVMRSRGVNPMESGLGVFLLLNLGITFLIPGISIGGHIGGLVGGGLAALVLFELRDRLRAPASVSTGLAVGLGLVFVVASVVVSG
jgi:membrane associated rhomboid family serine protease